MTASGLRELALQGQLQPTSLIWKEGMGDWVPASKVKDITFATAAPAVPPPLPTSLDAADPSPAASGDFSFAPVRQPAPRPAKQGMSVLAWALIGVGSACVFGIVAVVTWNLVRPRTLVEEVAHHQKQQNSKAVIAKSETEIAKKETATRRHIQECRWWSEKPSDVKLDLLIDLIVNTNAGYVVWIDAVGRSQVESSGMYQTTPQKYWRMHHVPSGLSERCFFLLIGGSRRTTKAEALEELRAAVDRLEFEDGPAPGPGAQIPAAEAANDAPLEEFPGGKGMDKAPAEKKPIPSQQNLAAVNTVNTPDPPAAAVVAVEKPAASESLPTEFQSYFERADERKAELIMAAEAKVALKEIEVRGAAPKIKAARKRELSDMEESLRDLKKAKSFDFLIENRAINQQREANTIGVLGSCDVQAVIDEHTIVANCRGGPGGPSITAVLKMDSTKGIRANSKLTPSDVWQVTSTDGLEDEAVAVLLNRSGAVRGKVKVLKIVKRGELEKYRAAYEAVK